MLTETQFKVLMILFDDRGHAGWQLAETLDMEESNLNPLLKKLEKKNFIFQGPPRKSNRPKKSKNIEKRDGDYKEFPYYIKKDLKILGSIIKELVVTNKSYDLGFPYRIIRASRYMIWMRETFGEEFNRFLSNLSNDLNISKINYCKMWRPLIIIKYDQQKIKQLHFLNSNEEVSPIKERRISKELLEELEIWWIRYEIGTCFSKDQIDFLGLRELNWDIPPNYIVGDDIKEAIFATINKMSEHQRKEFSEYETRVFGKRYICIISEYYFYKLGKLLGPSLESISNFAEIMQFGF